MVLASLNHHSCDVLVTALLELDEHSLMGGDSSHGVMSDFYALIPDARAKDGTQVLILRRRSKIGI